jgi:hypothetical protein
MSNLHVQNTIYPFLLFSDGEFKIYKHLESLVLICTETTRNTYEHLFRNAGGFFSEHLGTNSGWLFHNDKYEEIIGIIHKILDSIHNGTYTINDSFVPTDMPLETSLLPSSTNCYEYKEPINEEIVLIVFKKFLSKIDPNLDIVFLNEELYLQNNTDGSKTFLSENNGFDPTGYFRIYNMLCKIDREYENGDINYDSNDHYYRHLISLYEQEHRINDREEKIAMEKRIFDLTTQVSSLISRVETLEQMLK